MKKKKKKKKGIVFSFVITPFPFLSKTNKQFKFVDFSLKFLEMVNSDSKVITLNIL